MHKVAEFQLAKCSEKSLESLQQHIVILYDLFSDYSKAWKVDPGIRIEGLLLTCQGSKTLGCNDPKKDLLCRHSATYREHFSTECPHFEVRKQTS